MNGKYKAQVVLCVAVPHSVASPTATTLSIHFIRLYALICCVSLSFYSIQSSLSLCCIGSLFSYVTLAFIHAHTYTKHTHQAVYCIIGVCFDSLIQNHMIICFAGFCVYEHEHERSRRCSNAFRLEMEIT